MKNFRNYQLIRDKPKVEKILNLILIDKKNFKVTRNDKYSIRIYYDLNEIETIYFDIYHLSDFAINQIKNEKEKKNEIEF